MMNPRNFPSSWSRVPAALVFLFIGTALSSRAETVDAIARTLEAQPGGSLVLRVHGGRVEVNSGPGSAVKIDIERRISRSSKEDEEAYLRERPLTIAQDGATITIREEGEKGRFSRTWKDLFLSLFRFSSNRYDARYSITVPSKFSADIATAGGPIDVEGLDGEVRAKTSGGPITIERCQGALVAGTSGGPITVSGSMGPLVANTSGGPIRVSKHTGNVTVDTSGGGITLDAIAGNIEADTSGGGIRATMLEQPTADCHLSTSGGGITVNLPSAVAVEIDASTSGGSVRSDFAVQGAESNSHKRNSLKGSINGGGPLLRLKTSGGGIHIAR